jgi:hypothetical protein
MAITGAQTLEVLLGVLFQHSGELNAFHTPAALGRLAKLVTSSHRGTPIRIEEKVPEVRGAPCAVAPLAATRRGGKGDEGARPQLLKRWPIDRNGAAAVKAALDVLLRNLWFQVSPCLTTSLSSQVA